MMVSVETYLLRGKRRWDQLWEHPAFRFGSKAILYGGGGFLLSGGKVWSRMQPLAAGLVSGCAWPWSGFAAVGSILGYQVFWGSGGIQGALWSLGALALGLLVRKRPGLLAMGNALFTAAVGLGCRAWLGITSPPEIYGMQVAMAAAGSYLTRRLADSRDAVTRWLSCGLGVMALGGMDSLPFLNPGCVAAGAVAVAAPLPAAALAGVGLEAAGLPYMTAGLCIAVFLRLLPVRDPWNRMAAAPAGCLIAMVLGRYWDAGSLIGVGLGGLLGMLIPRPKAQTHTGTGAAQVQLEQAARLFMQMQRTLLDSPTKPLDEEGILAQLRENACGQCVCRNDCAQKDQLTTQALTDPLSVRCRKNNRLLREIRKSREQIRFLKGQRTKLGEYRSALVQQYGFLAGYLQLMADRLPTRIVCGDARYRIQVGARSSRREIANGDLCMAFPGVGLRFYVLLCDGMGTGFGAAQEGRQAADLVKQMLCAGLPPQYAMGTVNTHLALRGQAGAVTLDIAEIRLDTGRAAVYKWGAAQSLVLRHNRAEKVGTVTPPPGISVTETRESVVRLSLKRGEVLVLASDGMDLADTSGLAEMAGSKSPGELAGYILRKYGGSGEDDATAAVIRLRPVNLNT